MISSEKPLTKLEQVAKNYATKEDVKLSDMQYIQTSQSLLFTKKLMILKLLTG